MVLLAWRYEVRRQGIRNVVTLSFDPGHKQIDLNNIFLLKMSNVSRSDLMRCMARANSSLSSIPSPVNIIQ